MENVPSVTNFVRPHNFSYRNSYSSVQQVWTIASYKLWPKS